VSDERLREAERRWRETGAVEDEARWLKECVRAGDLDPEHFELVGALGHPAACLALDLPRATPDAASIVELVRDRSWPALMAGLVAWAEQIALEVPACAALADPLRATARTKDPLDRRLRVGEVEAERAKEQFVMAGAFEQAAAARTLVKIYEHARGWADEAPRETHALAFRRGVVRWALG
jgi:hypothetical protein